MADDFSRPGRFVDKVVMVLGGNSGIGRASALAFAAEGARLIVTGRNPETLAQVDALLGERGRCVQSDIGDLAASQALMDDIAAREGRIDVLFVNAGTGAFRPVESVDEAFYDSIMQVNLKGPYFAVKHASPLLAEGASVILTSSMGHCKGIAGNSVYAASKAGLRALARNFGVEFVKRELLQPRAHRHAPGHARRHERGGDLRLPQDDRDDLPDGAVRITRGGGRRRAVPCLQGVQLRDRDRPAGRWRRGQLLKESR